MSFVVSEGIMYRPGTVVETSLADKVNDIRASVKEVCADVKQFKKDFHTLQQRNILLLQKMEEMQKQIK